MLGFAGWRSGAVFGAVLVRVRCRAGTGEMMMEGWLVWIERSVRDFFAGAGQEEKAATGNR